MQLNNLNEAKIYSMNFSKCNTMFSWNIDLLASSRLEALGLSGETRRSHYHWNTEHLRKAYNTHFLLIMKIIWNLYFVQFLLEYRISIFNQNFGQMFDINPYLVGKYEKF